MTCPTPRFQRAFDLALAVPLAVVAVVPCLVLMLAIRAESPGSPLFVQQRMGRGRRQFAMFKLRTMRAGTVNAASHEVGSASVTRLGAVLRRLKLDELPQLVNVLVGHMSFVGPRPCLPSQTDLINERDRRDLFAIRPGITGPAQIDGIDMSDPARLAAREYEYFGARRPSFDWPILLQTFTGSGRGDAAARVAE